MDHRLPVPWRCEQADGIRDDCYNSRDRHNRGITRIDGNLETPTTPDWLTPQSIGAATPELAVLRAAAGWLSTRCWR